MVLIAVLVWRVVYRMAKENIVIIWCNYSISDLLNTIFHNQKLEILEIVKRGKNLKFKMTIYDLICIFVFILLKI